MPKRKHEEISWGGPTPNVLLDRALRLQRQKLEGLLEQGKKSLFRALKVARGFERQKLGRRQKAAKAEKAEADIARLDSEVAALKSLDLAVTAEMHLYKLLLKIRIMASAPSFPRHVQTTVDAAKKPLDTPCANVQARLFKSDPVKAAMTEVLGGIRRILGVDEVKVSVKKKRLRAKDYENGLPGEKSVETLVSSNKKISVPIYQDSEDWGELSGQEGAVAAGKGSGGDTEEEGYDVYGSRLAASSDEDSRSEESASENTEIEDLDPDSITEGDIDSDTEESHPLPKSKPKSTKAASLGAAPKSTTFLPSLSMGGYWSGSDSAEDLSDTEPQGRKNRMGQQARRALWEKKFGKNANHIKKQPQNRDEGWDTRRGASVGDERGKRGRGRGGFRRESGRSRGGGGRGPMSSGANSDPIAMRKTKPKPAADAPLHPSWEAAKKAKEQKKTVAFQGKKVVFD